MGRIPDHLVRLAVRALENRWVTIGAKADSKRPGKKKGGTPVELDGEGKITKGPAALTGKRPSELSQSHMFSGQDHKSQRKMFAEPGDPPPPPAIEETPKAPPPAAKKEPKPRETVADQAEKGLDGLYQKQDQKTDGTGEMFGGLFSPGRTSGATEPVAPPAVEPSGPVSSKGKMDAAQRRNLVQLNPIQGPSGAKLVGYNWEFDREHYVDQRGEDRERKVSAWDRAEKAGMTNRDIVHMFTVEGPDGKQQNVSLETAAKMLGFDGGSDQFKAKFKSATSAAKTMARLQMEKAQVEQAAASRAKDMAELKQQAPAMDDGQTEEVPNFLGNRLGLRLKGTQSAVAFGGDGGRTKDEARKILQDSWIKDELKKRGHNPYSAPSVGDIDRRILRAKNKLDELTKQQGPEAPKPEAGPAAQPTVEPSPPATAPKSQSFDDYRQANGVKGYTVDHSMLSPSGKVSGRSANAAQARVDKQFSDYSQAEKEYQAKVDAGEIVDPKGKYQKPDQAKANKGEADLLRNKAKQFRTIAASGMQTRKLTKQAEELEKQANELDPVAKAEAGPVAPPKVEAPKANVIGKGSTGEVVKIGNEVHKNAKGPEGRIYKELSGVDGIAKGRQEGDKIITPHFKNTLSQDDVPKGNRQSFGPVVKKNLSRIVGAVNALSEKGYDYNDPLQIGFDNDRSAHLFDFSNAQKSNTAIQDNLSHLGTFLSEFGLPRHGDAVSKIAHLYDYLNNQDTRDFDSDSQESKDATKILSQLGGQVPKFAYYTFNARAVPNVAQTEKEPGPNSAKLVFSTKPLNKNFMDTWEIMPAIHKDTTPESRTLSTIRQQLREAFRQCP